jgi:segregation and condensation protein B
VTVKELRGAIGLSRERLETAYDYLLANPPLGLTVQRNGEEFSLVTATEVASSIERHLGNPRAVALSRAALEVLAIVAYRQPIARTGIELIRGSAQRQRARHAARARAHRAQCARAARLRRGLFWTTRV